MTQSSKRPNLRLVTPLAPPTEQLIGASASGEYFLKAKGHGAWISVKAVIAKSPEVDAWRHERGLPPLSGPQEKAFLQKVEALLASGVFPAVDIIDRPGRHGARYVMPSAKTYLEGDAAKPKRAFRKLPAVFSKSGDFRSYKRLLVEVAAHPAAAAIVSLSLVAVLQDYLPLNDNPILWLWGQPGTGKTTLLRLAAAGSGHPLKGVMSAGASSDDLDAMMRIWSGGLLLLDNARLEIGARGVKSLPTSSLLEAIGRGAVSSAPGYAEPFRLAGAIASNQPLADHLAGLSFADAAARMDRILTVSVDAQPLAPLLARRLNASMLEHHGWLMRRFVRRLVEMNATDPASLKVEIEKHESDFSKLIEGGSSYSASQRIVDLLARIHAAGCLGVKLRVLPKGFADATIALRCLEAHLQTLSQISPLEQVLALASDPNIIDLREELLHLNDSELDKAIFIRAHRGRLQLVMSHTKFRSSVSHPDLVASDPAVRRIRQGDADHQTMQVRVRKGITHDRMLCFNLPTVK